MIVTYVDVRDSAVSQLRKHFEPIRNLTVEAHPGKFSEEELRRIATRTPAVLTSLIRITDRGDNDESSCQFVTWVITRANQQDKLYDYALKLVSAVVAKLLTLDSDWGYEVTHIDAECLYSDSLDRVNATMWAISWKWKIRGAIVEGTDGGILQPDDLAEFEGADGTLKVSPAASVAEKTEINEGGL